MMIRSALPAIAAMALLAGPAAAQSADDDLAPLPSEDGITQTPVAPAEPPATAAAPVADGYAEEDVMAAAEGVFGKGAEGAAKLIEKAFKDLGRPNAYIEGREVSGALVVGLRYGSGTMHHQVEGDIPVHWSGPSIGFDVGGDGSKTFTLVYNLHDTEELFRNFPSVEGKLYAVGGFTANYLQRGDIVLVPIKVGVGWRAGVNAGSQCFSKKRRWIPICAGSKDEVPAATTAAQPVPQPAS
ncbi:MAG: DUF1134 domain-containing protein [Sphingomonadaceae bacterium]|nr:DUF1134 domain-containing protein [Sphingomonadaceae bacterium]